MTTRLLLGTRTHSCTFAACWVLALVFSAACISGCRNDDSSSAAAATSDLPSDDEIRQQLDEVLEFTSRRVLPSDRNAGWQIMHAVVAFRKDTVVEHEGRRIYALDLALNGEMRGWNMRVTKHGVESWVEGGSAVGPGHPDQWLSVMGSCGLPYEQEFFIDPSHRRVYTFADLVAHASATCSDDKEATWTLNGLRTYLPRDPQGPKGRGRMTDAEWATEDGEIWNFERLLALETRQDLTTSACGGTHRLAAIGMAVERYMDEQADLLEGKPLAFHSPRGMGNAYVRFVAAGGELTGAWREAHEKVQKSVATIMEFQQPDGTFSTQFFIRPGSSDDASSVIHSTGHTLETLCLLLSDDELKQPWVKRSVMRLCQYFQATREMEVECGALYHAANGLLLYRNRVFGPQRFIVAVDEPLESPSERPLLPPDKSSTPAAARTTPKPESDPPPDDGLAPPAEVAPPADDLAPRETSGATGA